MPTEVPGVYIITVMVKGTGIYLPVYVGQTGDLRVRLAQHLSNATAKPAIREVCCRFPASFSGAPVLDPLERLRIESGLIRRLQPIGNDQVPVIAPLYPNLPPLFLPHLAKD